MTLLMLASFPLVKRGMVCAKGKGKNGKGFTQELWIGLVNWSSYFRTLQNCLHVPRLF